MKKKNPKQEGSGERALLGEKEKDLNGDRPDERPIRLKCVRRIQEILAATDQQMQGLIPVAKAAVDEFFHPTPRSPT
jgi:hypothetical protein